jgi:hypothetical protein
LVILLFDCLVGEERSSTRARYLMFTFLKPEIRHIIKYIIEFFRDICYKEFTKKTKHLRKASDNNNNSINPNSTQCRDEKSLSSPRSSQQSSITTNTDISSLGPNMNTTTTNTTINTTINTNNDNKQISGVSASSSSNKKK